MSSEVRSPLRRIGLTLGLALTSLCFGPTHAENDTGDASDVKVYPPGPIDVPCSMYNSHPDATPGPGETQTIEMVGSRVFFAGRRGEPSVVGEALAGGPCERVEIPVPGEYDIETVRARTQWKYECDPLFPSRCQLRRTKILQEVDPPAVQRIRVSGNALDETPDEESCDKKQDPEWINQFDGCSVYVETPLSADPLEMPNDRNNPAGGRDTQFANPRGMLPIRGPCRPGDACGPCDKHDICYQTCGSNRGECDYQMYQDMLSVCEASTESEAIKEKCRAFAGSYWGGLAGFGKEAFEERQGEVCICR